MCYAFIMKIYIKIEDKRVKISLKKEDKVLSQTEFEENNNLSGKLLFYLDLLIRKNKLKIQDIRQVKLISDMAKSYTTYRIAKSITSAFNWAVNCG